MLQWLCFGVLLLLLFYSGTQQNYNMSILQRLFREKEEADYKKLVEQGAVIVDVRSKEEFDTGHIKGALNIPLDELSLNIKKVVAINTCVITCCASGGRSSVAKNMLHNAGYDNVHNGGGWNSLQRILE